jgi:hypothetical protein
MLSFCTRYFSFNGIWSSPFYHKYLPNNIKFCSNDMLRNPLSIKHFLTFLQQNFILFYLSTDYTG